MPRKPPDTVNVIFQVFGVCRVFVPRGDEVFKTGRPVAFCVEGGTDLPGVDAQPEMIKRRMTSDELSRMHGGVGEAIIFIRGYSGSKTDIYLTGHPQVDFAANMPKQEAKYAKMFFSISSILEQT